MITTFYTRLITKRWWRDKIHKWLRISKGIIQETNQLYLLIEKQLTNLLSSEVTIMWLVYPILLNINNHKLTKILITIF